MFFPKTKVEKFELKKIYYFTIDNRVIYCEDHRICGTILTCYSNIKLYVCIPFSFDLILTFLLTYTGFTTSAELLEELSYRWEFPDNPDEKSVRER